MSKKVLSHYYLPTRYPMGITGLSVIYMDFYNAPHWVWVTVCIALAIIWLAVISNKMREETVSPKELSEETRRQTFKERIKEIKDEGRG